MVRQLENKVVVITGASSGFGKGAALKYAELGASLVLAARRDELLDELVIECKGRDAKAIAVPCDVSVQDDVQNLVEQAIENFGRIDVWINNAGGSVVSAFTEAPLAEHVKVIEVDLLGTMYGSYFAMKEFLRQGAGTLINVASMLGKIPAPYYVSYSAAKHGVVGLSAALRQEMQVLKQDKIKICTVMPMAMDTNFFRNAANHTGKKGVPIPPLDDAQKVVDVLVDLATHPKDEVPVGNTSGIFKFMDEALPGMTESMMAMNTHKAQIVDAPPEAPKAGSLTEPSYEGTQVHDPEIQVK